MSTSSAGPNHANPCGPFVTTRWSQVLMAGHSSSADSEQALSQLCRTYWYPLYAFIRRQGYACHDAEDLTQAFFTKLLEKKSLRAVAPDKGRFRSFLLASLKNFMTNEWDRQRTVKRGGKHSIISWDEAAAEDRYLREPSHEITPEKLFDRSWALTVIENALQQLRREFTAAGKAHLFEALHHYLSADEDPASYAQSAARLHMKEGAVRMSVMRMRRRFRYLLRAEMAQIVADPSQLEAELRYLVASMGV